jgi:hypothetical protein
MDNTRPQPETQLFTLRLWLADVGDGQTEWRGRLQHVMSGRSRYFRDWPALVAHLCSLLTDIESVQPGDEKP